MSKTRRAGDFRSIAQLAMSVADPKSMRSQTSFPSTGPRNSCRQAGIGNVDGISHAPASEEEVKSEMVAQICLIIPRGER